MNALYISTALLTSVVAVLTSSPFERSASSKPQARTSSPAAAPAEPTRDWEATVVALSNDPNGFWIRSFQDIEGYGLATQAMARRCEESRSYLKTRLQALREHLDYARAELQKLPTSESDPDFNVKHAHFHRTMNGLQEAFTQVLNEVTDGT
jgi:hypothetical protein